MLRLAVLAATCLTWTACTIDHVDYFPETPYGSVDLYDDGAKVRVLACNEAAPFGCRPEPADASLTVTVDGTTYSSESGAAGEPQPDEVLSLFTARSLRVAAPAPSDRTVDVALAPSGYAARVALPPIPAIDQPTAVSRSAGPITIAYEARPEASLALAIVTMDCPGTADDAESTRDIPVPGTLEVDLAALTGATADCTQSIQVDQVVPGDGARIITIARTTFASTP